ncbi:hypothetical protein [Flavobacterium sp. CAU 1735]|uniref:hypothetical protein n=1 Tax=Flavobacterium sp. CAU 1735 TaxID=3140361 RepID=UPI003260D09D
MKAEKLNKKYSPEELADSFVFRNNLTVEQKEEAADELKRFRKKNVKPLTDSQLLYARVQQLRFQIEDYLKSDIYDAELSLPFFLKKYINLRYKINKDFAEDIKVSESELNSILNMGKPPSKKIIIRLELHSNNFIPALYWYKLLEKEKEYEIQIDKKIRKEEAKYVQNRLILDF